MSVATTVNIQSSEESDWEIKSTSESSDEDKDEIPQQTIVLKKSTVEKFPDPNQQLIKEDYCNKITSDKLKKQPEISDQKSVFDEVKINIEKNLKNEIQILPPATTIIKIKKSKKATDSGNTSSTSIDKDSEDQSTKLETVEKVKNKNKVSDQTENPLQNGEHTTTEKKTVKKSKKKSNEMFVKEGSVNSVSSDNTKASDVSDKKVKVTKKKVVKSANQTQDDLEVSKTKSTKKKTSDATEGNDEKKKKTVSKKSKDTGKKSENQEDVVKKPKKIKNIENSEIKKEKKKQTMESTSNLTELNTETKEKIVRDVLDVKEGVIENIVIKPDAKSCEQPATENNFEISPRINEHSDKNTPIEQMTKDDTNNKKPSKKTMILDEIQNEKQSIITTVVDSSALMEENEKNFGDNRSNEISGTEPNITDSCDVETNLDQWMKDLLARHNIKREDVQTNDISSPDVVHLQKHVDEDFELIRQTEKSPIKIENCASKDNDNDSHCVNVKNERENYLTNEIFKTVPDNFVLTEKKTKEEKFSENIVSEDNIDKNPTEELEWRSKDRLKVKESFNGKDYENSDEEIEAISRYLAKRLDNQTFDYDNEQTKYKKENDSRERKRIISKKVQSNEFDDDDIIRAGSSNEKIRSSKQLESKKQNDDEESFMTRFRREKYSSSVSSPRQHAMFQPKRREDTDEKIKEKTRHVRALIDKQKMVIDNLKNSSKKLSELESMIKEAKTESLDQKAEIENLEFALDSAHKQYEHDLKEAIEQTDFRKRNKSEDVKNEINAILKQVLSYTRDSDYLKANNFQHSKSSKRNFDELDFDDASVTSKSTSNEFGDIMTTRNRMCRNNFNGYEEEIVAKPLKNVEYLKYFENGESNEFFKNRSGKNYAEENNNDPTSMSAEDFIKKIRLKYAIQPPASNYDQLKDTYNSNKYWNTPSNRSSISDFSLLENKYSKLSMGNSNQYDFDKSLNRRHSLTKRYDESSDNDWKYQDKNSKKAEITLSNLKHEKTNAILYQSKFLKSANNSNFKY